MTISSENSSAKQQAFSVQRLWPRAVELWIFGILVGFLLIRVLGSHTALLILNRLGLTHS